MHIAQSSSKNLQNVSNCLCSSLSPPTVVSSLKNNVGLSFQCLNAKPFFLTDQTDSQTSELVSKVILEKNLHQCT